MKGNPDVIKVLNEVLRKELTGVNQYFIHAKMCRNWGYEVLANVHWKESIDEMKHADQIIERILFLEGVPNVQAYDKIQLGSNVKQQLENDRASSKRHLQFSNRESKRASNIKTTPPVSCSNISSLTRNITSTGSKRSCIRSKSWDCKTTYPSKSSRRTKRRDAEVAGWLKSPAVSKRNLPHRLAGLEFGGLEIVAR